MHDNDRSQTAGLPATPEVVHQILDDHVETHRRFPESARLRDLGAERALVQDYSGRVVFELLQNALDRAEREIEVRWDARTRVLEVANDGRAITVEAPEGKRSDLTALLTLHTSSKSARDSVGNKGVGFRSVFASSTEVDVCSQAADGTWWGIRLRHPARLDPTDERWTDDSVASFYAPERCGADEARVHCTVIRLRGVRNPSVVGETVQELQRGPLTFLERRAAPGLRIRLISDDGDVTHTLGEPVYRAIREASVPLSDAVRESTGLDLDRGEVRVLCERTVGESGEDLAGSPGRYWSYLPTEQPAGFGLQVHGDFYLSNSRRNLALRRLRDGDPGEDPAGWNARLVELSADCVLQLWQDPVVCEMPGFWRNATPAACQCPHLKLAVARRLWGERGAVFEEMTRLSFPAGRRWPLRRHRDYFDALMAWADFAYRAHVLGGRARYRRVRDLLARAQASGAPVLPIITGDPQDLGAIPSDARPLVAGRQGQRKGPDADRIYHLRFDPQRVVDVPAAVRRQRTFVTTFDPNVDSNLGPQGLLPFDRLEILAQLRPGGDAGAHAELLRAAMALARQESRGGPGSLLQRARISAGGAAWRFVPITENVNRAGFGLAGLHVPTRDGGWCRAADCGTVSGPWSVADLTRLADALEVRMDSQELDDACRLLGLTPVPLGDVGTASLPSELPSETGEELLQQWGRFGDYLDHERGHDLRRALAGCRWLRPGDGRDLRHGADGDQAPYRPRDVWCQQAARGFTTKLLPRLILESGARPTWVRQVGIDSPAADWGERERLTSALRRLHALDARVLYDEQRDLVELYRALVGSLLTQSDPPSIPLLVRPVDEDGRRLPLRWAGPEEVVWHEPTRTDLEALRSFCGVLHWVVRKQPESRLKNLDLRHFRVEDVKVSSLGDSGALLETDLRAALADALPDLLAAGSSFHAAFDAGEALDRFTAMNVRHFADIWIEWRFDGKVGRQGEREQGDVFLRTLPDGRRELCFDGERLPLARCAYPLSELLAENRAFGPLFKDALHAWNNAAIDGGASVQRFRRERGLTEPEVADWRGRVQASVMPPAERAAWQTELRRILECFGALTVEPAPGLVIRPDCFRDPLPVSEDEVRSAVSALHRLHPRVDFHHPHGIDLAQVDRRPLLAEKAERNRGAWTERNLKQWKLRLETPMPTEDAARRSLGFDARMALRRRIGLPPESIEPQRDAWSFAQGQIPLRDLPTTPPSGLALKRFRADSVDLVARDPQSDEDFIRQARRRARGGKRAEDAVLGIAVADALRWRRDDGQGFEAAFEQVAAVFEGRDGNKARARLEVADTEQTMRKLVGIVKR